MKEPMKFIFSISAVILIGLILMAATGLIVYYGFCPSVSRTAESTASSNSNCNCPHLPVCPVNIYCPIEPAEPCPVHPLMPALPGSTTCIPPCHCTDKKIITNSINVIKLEKWTEEQMMNQSVVEWVTAYPPNSIGRLNVLTRLMEFGVEPYVRAMSRRNCQSPYRMCTVCQDRYEFLRCAMRLTAKKFAYKANKKLKKINSDFLKLFATDAYWHSQKYDHLLTRDDYEPFIDNYRAFSLVGNEDGLETECSLCRDAIDPSIHMDCIRHGWGSI